MNNQTEVKPEDFVLDLSPGTSIKGVMKSVAAASRDLWQVPVGRIEVVDGFNVRVQNDEYHAGIRELADSMKADGFYQHKPLAGYLANDNGTQIICVFDGHRRLAAAQLAIEEGADIEFLPVVITKDGVSMEDLTISLVKTNTGKPLSPYEIAIVCKRLVNFGHEPKEVAKRLGFTPTYVANLLSLMAMPNQIQKMVTDNEVSATTAIELFAEHGSKAKAMLEDASKAAKSAGKEKITRRFVAGADFKKICKKMSEPMFETLTQVQSDPAFDHLAEDTRSKLILLVEALNKTKETAS